MTDKKAILVIGAGDATGLRGWLDAMGRREPDADHPASLHGRSSVSWVQAIDEAPPHPMTP